MSTQVNFNWGEEALIDGETFCPDCLERQRYAEFLASFLEGQNVNKPYVINLNSGWGTGKTYFLKRWKDDVGKTHPIVYIDVWKNDSSGDPFMAVISSIISQLRLQTNFPDDNFFQKGIAQSFRLLKQVGPLVIGSLAKRYLGDSIESITNEGINADKEIGDVATKIAASWISEHEKRAESIKALKESIVDWIEAVRGHKKKISPTFIIIDELDRCRPDYAVETLEVVKHIFDIPGVFFIIATDTEQLQHAIKVVYGHGFNAQVYLSRFFDSRFTLPVISLDAVISAHCNTMVFEHDFQRESNIVLWPQDDNLLAVITAIVDAFEMTARDAIQVVNRTVSVLLHAKEGSKLDIIYLVTLLCLQKADHEFYSSIVTSKKLNYISAYYNEKPWLTSSKLISFTFSNDQLSRETFVKKVPLQSYYKVIFSLYSDNFKGDNGGISFGIPDLGNMNADAIYNEIFKDAQNKHRSVTADEYTEHWMKYSYIKTGLNSVSRPKYKDLVELATSFDE
ncbi:hypothetical protein H9X98_15780 [Aeromonas jandaei]|uniref:KAP family P-loop NTPase fold protein n=1 Tax=Aeromonas jandaei TaxID=650 RepID=UPI001F2E4A60|nr:P-loop NTPase fold protein [Aeromonas jandaei]MCF7719130.1 hypothetical protein [Aeromonas jandaei]